MSEEIEDGNFGAFEPEPSTSETNGAGTSWLDEGESGADGLAAAEFGGAGRFELDEVRNDLLEAIEELGLGARPPDGAGSPGSGCYLSIVPMDRHGHGGVVVGWLLGDLVLPDETVRVGGVESVDILNEALGPLLLALGFPIEPYAVDGRWIVTGSRRTS